MSKLELDQAQLDVLRSCSVDYQPLDWAFAAVLHANGPKPFERQKDLVIETLGALIDLGFVRPGRWTAGVDGLDQWGASAAEQRAIMTEHVRSLVSRPTLVDPMWLDSTPEGDAFLREGYAEANSLPSASFRPPAK